ncbi:MerR family transcriptional regulator [Actinotalea sp. K2]|uniref:transcriptional regulator FtsR n=1 Tax=Actinotalea sp. K2 TaxID=2939438 RepID=UPI0020179EFC|nr:MerR family transcriptional regulator [Actinotalea sp. K2]MCL3862418.1 MerR family transcriptional regulator [Actinotalea sp. K2]
MRISDVLGDLGADFPAVTPSKLRFLEDQGLVEPRRTAGGYRQYSPADVERLRYVLRQQRDRYLPLRVIGEQLAALDAGELTEPLTPARLATQDGERTAPTIAGRYTAASLAREAGATVELVEQLVEAGVLRPGPTGHLDEWAREVVVVAAALAEHGVEPRHLKSFRSAADRQVSVVDQIVAPLRGQRAPGAQERAGAVAAELGELCGRLHTTLVRGGLSNLTP